MMKHYLSIDFESWAYPDLPDFKKLSSRERKRLDAGFVRDSAEMILAILKKHRVRLTFFVLGQLYDWYPASIEKIAQEGHEIGYHTHTHNLLKTKKDLIDSFESSGKFIKKFKPVGFRAPLIKMKREYYALLREHGFGYSSSVYGDFSLNEKVEGISELPVFRYGKLPVGSGYFTALLGKRIDYFYRGLEKRGKPMVSFLHNWQIVRPEKAVFPNFSYLLKNPHYLPYILDVKKTFEHLLNKFPIGQMKDLV